MTNFFWKVKRIDTQVYQVKGKDIFGDGGFVVCYCIGKINADRIANALNNEEKVEEVLEKIGK